MKNVDLAPGRKLISGAFVLMVGRVAVYSLSFLRNLILVRLLTKADYGLASAFGMAISLLEVSGKMAFGSQIIQSREGDSESFQSTAHAVQFITGMLSAAFVVALAAPFAHGFGVPSAGWVFACLAIVPLFRSLEHLDNYRQQRQLNYLPVVLCELVPQLLTASIAWPLTLWLGDYRVIVWLIIINALLAILMSHLVAHRPFRWGWNREHAGAMFTFGWPLLLNSLLLFAAQQADQFVIGASYSLESLAVYSLAFSLTSIPWFLFSQIGTSLMLPTLARVQDSPQLFNSRYRHCIEVTAVAAVVLTSPLIITGEQIVRLLYGSKYSGTGVFVSILGAAFAIRFIRFAPAIGAMARADTVNQLYSNLWRAAGLPLAIAVVLMGGAPPVIACCALVAEVVAAAASLRLLSRRQFIPLRDSLVAAAYVFVFVMISVIASVTGVATWNLSNALIAAAVHLLVSLWTGRLFFPEITRFLLESLRRTKPPALGAVSPH